MKVSCACGAAYEVPAELSGKTIRCRKCGEHFAVPGASAPQRPAVTAPMDPQATIQQPRSRPVTPPAPAAARGPKTAPTSRPPAPSGPSSGATQWVAPAAPVSDSKSRAEREEQLVGQYIPYQPAAGKALRGADLHRAIRLQQRSHAKALGWRYFGIAVTLTIMSVVGYIALDRVDSGEASRAKVHWLMAFLYSIGGKWTAAIGLGVFALICLIVAVMYWVGWLGNRKD